MIENSSMQQLLPACVQLFPIPHSLRPGRERREGRRERDSITSIFLCVRNNQLAITHLVQAIKGKNLVLLSLKFLKILRNMASQKLCTRRVW